ncbi:MAG: hypothetical protein V4450_10010 [Bacteroidota bacterium]
METTNKNTNLVARYTDPNSAMNFESLRARAISLVQEYSGNAWSDFNLHDPGVTILEALCFAITDMAYRTNFDIKDLLTGIDGKISAEKNLFYPRKEILTTNPFTVNDLRKLVLDSVPEVYNVWLEKIYSNQQSGYSKGLYNVVIQLFDPEEEMEESVNEALAAEQMEAKIISLEEEVIGRVKNIVLSNRNLGEDYISFTILKPCTVEIEANIVIDRHVHNEEILAEVYCAIESMLNPPLYFYTESDLLDRGFGFEEMYSGPFLQHGFLLDSELDARTKIMDPADLVKSTRYRIIDPSDILRAITVIPGINYVRDFRCRIAGDYRETPYRLPVHQFAKFIFSKEIRDIFLSNDNNEIRVKESLFYSILYKKKDFAKRKFIKGLHQTDQAGVLSGIFKDVGQYYSLQYFFPPVYRLAMDQMDSMASSLAENSEAALAAKAKSKQLKAYLMFFEQILANYLAQLANLENLVTADIATDNATYFTQPLYAVPGAGNILQHFYTEEKEQTDLFWSKFKANPENSHISFLKKTIETDDVYKTRKARVLDHLMSRFNLNVKKHAVVFFNQLFNPDTVDERNMAELMWKSGLVKDFISLSRNRNRAINYLSAIDPLNASGFDILISRLLYIQQPGPRKLTDVMEKYQQRFGMLTREEAGIRPESTVKLEPADWLKTTKAELIIEEDDSSDLGTRGLVFPKQTIGFLKDGLDSKNYRIGPDVSGSGFMLIYKAPADQKWIRAGRFADLQSATDGLSTLIDTLRKINIESEGFHVVEHILLRPSLDSDCFGFNFYDEDGHILFYQNKWQHFLEREETIEKIMSVADHSGEPDYAEMATTLKSFCWINHWENQTLVKSYNAHMLYQYHPALARKLFDKIIRNIRVFRKKRMTLYPGFENVVNRLHETAMREDFFHFRITIVLPSWPARFQDHQFRVFVENVFREYAPVHMKMHFNWLGIARMKQFEALYFDWRESMQADMRTGNATAKSDKLISFIDEGMYTV